MSDINYWQLIETVPREEAYGWIRWDDGSASIVDLNEQPDPEHWAMAGAVAWRRPTEEELANYGRTLAEEWQWAIEALSNPEEQALRAEQFMDTLAEAMMGQKRVLN